MFQIMLLIAPIFSLIALGFLVAKARYLIDGAARALVDYGYKVAVPAMLFRAMSQVGEVPVSPLLLLGAYGGGIVATWTLATLACLWILRRPSTDAPAIAMGSCFGNGVMLGIPLILAAFGPDAATPIAFLVSIETAFLWTLGMTHYELAARGARSISLSDFGAIVGSVAKNPIVLSIFAGLALRSTGLSIPELPDQILQLIAQSAIPVSLFGLGMALAAYDIRGQATSILLLCILKMLLYPAIAYVLATYVFDLPPVWIGALVMYAAMPVGNNAFLFAARYEKAVSSVSAAVAISTPTAIVTVAAVIALLQLAGLPAYRH